MPVRRKVQPRIELVSLKKAQPPSAPVQRMAGEELTPDKLDDLLESITELAPAPEDGYAGEQLRQAAVAQAMHPEVSVEGLINGTSRTAEQQVARGLLFDGVMPDVLPADRYAVADLADRTQRGVAGPFQPDSAVLQGTTGGLDADGVLDVVHTANRTEALSPEGEERLFQAWRQLNRGGTRQNFNEAVGEYTGQQILKAIGNKAVLDHDRSIASMNAPAGISTMGTDRLVENSRGLLDRTIENSGDFRYVDPQGYITVGDYQTGNPEDTLRLNLLKAVTLADRSQAINFQDNWKAAGKSLMRKGMNPTPDNIVTEMRMTGTLPEYLKLGTEPGRPGVRAGKILSGNPQTSRRNRDNGEYGEQYQYNEVLYGHTDPVIRKGPKGYIPQDVILVDTAGVNKVMGDKFKQRPSAPYLTRAETRGHAAGTREVHEFNVGIDELVQAGAARRLTDDPRVRQLLDQL